MKKTIFIAVFAIISATIVSKPIAPSGVTNILSLNKICFVSDDQQKKDTTLKTIYTCPMHPEVIQDKPGKCPKCGMNLVAKEVKKDVYTCPMHPEIVQDKPGKCPKCGMNLVKKEPVKKAGNQK